MLEGASFELLALKNQVLTEVNRIRKAAEANRRMIPTHPRYKLQFKKDIGYGLAASSIFLSALIGTGVYAWGLEERVNERVERTCAVIYCREDIPAMLAWEAEYMIPYGIDPKEFDPEYYLQKFPHPSRPEVRAWQEDYNRFNDLIPIAGGTIVSLVGLTCSSWYLGRIINRDRAHRQKLNLH